MSPQEETLDGLSLCAGVGGLDLALEIAFPQYRCIAAVENNEQAARRFHLRFPQTRMFRDVLQFDGRRLHGLVDCLAAGWPCQPHSVAGKRRGTADERWIWPDIARILAETGAPLFAGENVSGLLRDANGQAAHDGGWEPDDGDLDHDPDGLMGGMGTVLRDLAALGFVSVWGSLRASDVKASHSRPRVFILAYKPGGKFGIDRSAPVEPRHVNQCGGHLENAGRHEGRPRIGGEQDSPWSLPGEWRRGSFEPSREVANPGHGLVRIARRGPERRDGTGPASQILALAGEPGLPGPECGELSGPEWNHERGAASQFRGAPLENAARAAVAAGRSGGRRGICKPSYEMATGRFFAPGPSDPEWIDVLATSPHLAPALSPVTAALALALQEGTLDLQAEIESGFRGLADGVARWLVERRPRLQCGGNGVVPLQAAACFAVLARKLGLNFNPKRPGCEPSHSQPARKGDANHANRTVLPA